MRKRAVVVSLCLALVATVFGSGVAKADPTPTPKPAAGLLSESEAMRQAKSSGRPVEVSALTDERTLVTADPEAGTFRAEVTAGVARVRDSKGGWREPSTTLVQGADGLWRPEAAVADVAVSNGGGKQPLVSLADGDAKVAIGWPEKLPVPKIDGSTATYPEVFAGVDLVVQAELEAVETFLVVKTAAAGRNPAVRKAAFTFDAPGLSVKSSANGARSLRDADGVERLMVPPARMWDSKGAEAGLSRAEDRIGETDQARVGEVGLSVSKGTLTAAADASFLDDPATVYPVVIDPAVSMSQTYVVRVTETFRTINDMSVDAKLGYNGWTSPYYKSRMFYQFKWPLYSGTMIAPEQIVSAQFEYVQKHSPQADCSNHSFGPAQKVEFTNTINSDTTWGGPAVHPNIGSATNDYSVGHEDTCKKTYRQVFDVTSMTKKERTDYATRTTVTTRITSTNESDKNGWRHYKNTSGSSPKFIVDYQQAPLAPTNVKAWPLTAGGKVLSPVPLLSGTMRLPAGDSCPTSTPKCLVPVFTVTKVSDSSVVQTGEGAPVAPDATGYLQMTTALENDTSYRLDVQTKSLTTGYSGPVTSLTFSTDLDAAIPSLSKPSSLVTTTDTVALEGVGPAKDGTALPAASVQWRVAGAPDGLTGWVSAPAGSFSNITVAGGTPNVSVAGLFDTSPLVGLADGAGVTVPARVASLLELKVCLAYQAGLLCTPAVQVQRVAHAFGAGFPVADAGPGKVALWTGELSVDDTDAELTTPTGELSISRVHNSFAGPAIGVQNQVFGPGWTPSLDAAGGFSGAELVDGTATDATLSLIDADGSTLRWQTSTKKRRTTVALPTAAYTPLDKATKTAGVTIAVTNSGNLPTVKLTDEDGVETTFVGVAAPAVKTDQVVFKATGVKDKATNETSTLAYDGAGRVSAIVAALPDGVSSCAPGTPAKGCRVLKLSYTSGGLLETVKAQVNLDADRTLASYSYDGQGRLATVTDSRSGLVTSYTYTGTGPDLRLATVTPPGLAPFTFAYGDGKLVKVTRPNPASAGGGTAQLAAYVYNLPLTGTVPDLPNLATEVSKWGQASKPTQVFAVFGQDQPINGTPGNGDQAWKAADLQFTDAQGYTVNSASYGAGDWQLTAADYDGFDNVVMAWDARATAAIRAGQISTTDAPYAATKTVYDSTGTMATDTYSPARQAVAGNGTMKTLRAHTKTTYDTSTNALTGQPYRLPTKAVVTAETPAGAVDTTLSITLSGYEPLVAGDKSGWELGKATTTTVDMDLSGTVTAGDITRSTRYDARGRVIEERQPGSTNNAGVRATSYYTGASTGTAGCTSKPEWAGMTCTVGPMAQPAGQTLPVTKTTGYTWDLQETESVDTSGAVTSTTTTSYDGKDRKLTSGTATTLAGSQAVPAVTTVYDDATGQVVGTTSSAGNTATTFDTWGRQLTYTNTVGAISDTATTSYDAAGRVTGVADGQGETKYSYDGANADGLQERRGLVTKVETRLNGGTRYSSTAAHDQGGALITERLPGRVIRRTQLDVTGTPTGVTVNGAVGGTADQPWFGWTSARNTLGQVMNEKTTPIGAGFSPTVPIPASDLSYGYDRAGRLITVNDTRAGQCTVRLYGFDGHGNRTSQTNRSPGSGGACATTGGTTLTRAFDAADRPTTGANGTGSYSYDELGRQTSMPAADAPNAANKAIGLDYYDTDAAWKITQDGTTTEFSLDGAGRRWTQTVSSGGVTSQTLQRHYTDGDDNPTWTDDVRGGVTTTTRYAELASGNLGLTFTTTGGTTKVELAISGLRGDIATIVTIPAGSEAYDGNPVTTTDTWTDFDEYGQPKQAVTHNPGGTQGIGYGWLGQHQRATTDTGLMLMGARLYNPATGTFTSLDPQHNGGDTSYGYPNDPINKTDLTGENWLSSIGNWARRNYGSIATVAATVGCLVPGIGMIACGLMQAGAYALRTHQHMSQNGGVNRATLQRHWRRYAGDAIVTIASLGLGGALRYAKTGRIGWRNNFRGRTRYTEAYRNFTGSRYSRPSYWRSPRLAWRSGIQGRARRWVMDGYVRAGTIATTYHRIRNMR